MFNVNVLPALGQAPDKSGDSCWLLGHAHGAAGLAPYYGRDYCNVDKQMYMDGWQAGNAGRVLLGPFAEWVSPDPTASDDSDYAAMRIADVRPDDECPDFIAAFTMTNDQYYARLAEDEEPDAWTIEDFNRSRGLTVRGRVVHDEEFETMGRAI